HEAQKGAQVVEVEEEEAAVISELESDLEHARLRVVRLEHAGKEARPDLADGAADGMPGLAVEIPEDYRARLGGVARHPDPGRAPGASGRHARRRRGRPHHPSRLP